jgi:hypothetical protein
MKNLQLPMTPMRKTNRRYSRAQIQKIAEKYDITAEVWYSRQDGWWMETHTNELFLGSDSQGAVHKVIELLIKNSQ